MHISIANSMEIDHLKTPWKTTQNQKWRFVTDAVMGGLSTGKVDIHKIDGQNCYQMTGNVSTKNNGGFIQIRTEIIPNLKISDFEGIYLKIYGNNASYGIHIRTEFTLAPWQYYSNYFKSPNQWITIKLPFEKFNKSNFYQPKILKSQKIKSIGLVAGFKDYKANICLSEIGFY